MQPPSPSERRILHSPQLLPEYHDAYFATFVRDPDGHNVEAVCHIAEP